MKYLLIFAILSNLLAIKLVGFNWAIAVNIAVLFYALYYQRTK